MIPTYTYDEIIMMIIDHSNEDWSLTAMNPSDATKLLLYIQATKKRVTELEKALALARAESVGK